MLGIPSRPGLRVMVASKPIDFRNYAECMIMRSPGRQVSASNLDINVLRLID